MQKPFSIECKKYTELADMRRLHATIWVCCGALTSRSRGMSRSGNWFQVMKLSAEIAGISQKTSVQFSSRHLQCANVNFTWSAQFLASD